MQTSTDEHLPPKQTAAIKRNTLSKKRKITEKLLILASEVR